MPAALGTFGMPLLAVSAILILLGQGQLALVLLPALAMVAVGAWFQWRHPAQTSHPALATDLTEQADYPAHLRDRDPLTGLFNRHRFFELASAILTGDRDAVLTLLELDHMPGTDDETGRSRRDARLREFGKRLSGCIRQDDIAALWGNEQFVILYADVTPDEARLAVDRLRKILARTRMFGSGQRDLTISCGFAAIRSFSEIGDASRQAAEDLAKARCEGLEQAALTH